MWYLRHEARFIARNPGAWVALTGLVSIAAWPFGLTLRILRWMDSWGPTTGLGLRLGWTMLGLGWVYINNIVAGGSEKRAPTPSPSSASLAPVAIKIDQDLVPAHDAALRTLHASIAPRLGGGAFRVADAGEPYTLVKTVILSASGGSVPRGDTRARTMTAYLHRATSGPKYLIARVDIATGNYSEQPVDERHWGLLVG